MRIAPLLFTTVALLFTTVVFSTPAVAAPAQGDGPWKLTGDLGAHDPELVAGENGKGWYVFSTGNPDLPGGGTIQVRTSTNGKHWEYAGTIWKSIPEWIKEAVPGVNNLWAPDVFEHNGTYYMYYAASTFGHNTSVIGLATNKTLDPSDPSYEWVDKGEVISSNANSNYNAIDAGVVEDEDGTPWMAFGSYWSGIRMVQLEWPSGKPAAGTELLHIADRKTAPNAIEAAVIEQHDGWYYLFTSWGQCCQGTQSDYKVAVGRSKNVTGPYVDRDGVSMLEGGGTILVATEGEQYGPGGQSVSDGIIAYHFYDPAIGGGAHLALQRISWSSEDGWPELGSISA
ncbi:arabinan endo-1,5-alpha-L-arabinosidase [Pseudonocardia sp. TRM90224]|uniref:arabinan endo-1,5-alpha-L-arabinosidase n=1 Tax=Pseudonocardia sp. TRM90224 TaxID=2812678 RepID=UPI001E364FA9|nr:arabinan endo-1,5-alpha-L-arabinosidase [Pseudonocardia sp. TRM90224]